MSETSPVAVRPAVSWRDYFLADFSFSAIPVRGIVADIGCGRGTELEGLRGNGHSAFGIDVDEGALLECRSRGLRVLRAHAEDLPVRTASLDGVVCKVVVPYTDESRALTEIARVLKPGGVGHFSYHGAGYYLRYLLAGRTWAFRFYGLRTLVNTWLYALSGRRLPGLFGDTIYQSRRRLGKHYRNTGLRLRQNREAKTFYGWPVFIYHVVERAPDWTDIGAGPSGAA
jgi:SAM-dependent methyltransferase